MAKSNFILTGKKGDHGSIFDTIHIVDGKVDIDSIIKQVIESENQEEAFYVCDLGDILDKYENWQKILPRVETFYAVKCNDHPLILETMAALGFCFDCASDMEIKKIIDLGVHPDRIIFANPSKIIKHIKYAARVGVAKMTFDSEMELYKIKKNFPKAQLVLRIKCDDLDARYIFGRKFGCDPESEAPNLLIVAKSLKLNVIGVSFHIGSGSQNSSIFQEAIATARRIFNLAESMGFHMDFLDIGGGFPGEIGTSISEIGKVINKALDEHFPSSSTKIIAEPGKYYVNSAFYLAAVIHSMRKIKNSVNGNIMVYYINVGAYGALTTIFTHEQYFLRPLTGSTKGPQYESIVWGPTLDTFDKVAEKIVLPEMKIGDWLVIENAGAYTLVAACEFNGFPVPKVQFVIDREHYCTLKDSAEKSEFKNIIRNRYERKDSLKGGIGRAHV